MEFDILKRCVEKTIEQIYTREVYLIRHGLSEWALSAQFNYYMRKACQKALEGFSFDSEYNLMAKIKDRGHAQKSIWLDGGMLHVRPDFIIHKRDDPLGNFLWVEMKRRGGTGWKNDLKRCMSVTQERVKENGLDYVTGYSYGLGVLFRKTIVTCKWYAGGKEKCERVMTTESSGLLKWSDVNLDIGR